MAIVVEAIDVDVPVRTVYNQWTQFESFPQFMESVVEVRQLDETFVHWVAEIAGKRREWDTEIVRQVPDRVIAWRAIDVAQPSGEVSFEPIDDTSTHVVVRMDYEPRGAKESVASALGLDERRVKKDLERFKEVVESHGVESGGAWRRENEAGAVRTPELGTRSER